MGLRILERARQWGKSLHKEIESFLPPSDSPAVSLDDYLRKDPGYQNIRTEEIAKLLGFFTQKQLTEGFPWHPYKPKEPGSPRALLSDMEALRRLKEGKSIELKPMRVVNVSLSPDELQSVASLSSPISAAANVAANAAKANIGTKSFIKEVQNGAPIPIPNAAYLKLLYQLHTTAQGETPEDMVSKTAKDLSSFTAKNKFSSYQWSFHSPVRKPWKILRSCGRGFFKEALWAGIAGGVAGALLGGPLGAVMGIKLGGILHTLLAGTAIGVLAGGSHGVMKPLRSRNGEQYDEITALSRILNNKPVNFQKEKVQSFDLPILGSFSWTSEYGKPSAISNPQDLALFSMMLNSDQTPETKQETSSTTA